MIRSFRRSFVVLCICLSVSLFDCASRSSRQLAATIKEGIEQPNRSILKIIEAIPGVEVEVGEPDSVFKETFVIKLKQPLNHNNPNGEKFNQRILLGHIDFSRPVVFITEGYSLRRNYIQELSEILQANQIRVEHRFFGESKPDSMDWEYLNIRQAAVDHHRIVKLFKKIYNDKWISAGWSKGGQTALFHRRFYSNDVDVTVAYDAPLNFALEEPRIDEFFEKVGTQYCREKLIQFQRLILSHKEQILPLFKWYAKGKRYTYSIGIERAFEYIVLEYQFSFWQYHHIDCELIPGEDASHDEMLEHLRTVVSFSSYSDRAMNSSSMYQFSTELGYYGYVTKNVEDLLSCSDYRNTVFAPQNADLVYKPEIMVDINEWLQDYGNNIMYIYADQDPWSAPAVKLNSKINAVKKILKGGNHYTFIRNFSDTERDEIYSTLEKFGMDYLKLPMKRTDALFEVLDNN